MIMISERRWIPRNLRMSSIATHLEDVFSLVRIIIFRGKHFRVTVCRDRAVYSADVLCVSRPYIKYTENPLFQWDTIEYIMCIWSPIGNEVASLMKMQIEKIFPLLGKEREKQRKYQYREFIGAYITIFNRKTREKQKKKMRFLLVFFFFLILSYINLISIFFFFLISQSE